MSLVRLPVNQYNIIFYITKMYDLYLNFSPKFMLYIFRQNKCSSCYIF